MKLDEMYPSKYMKAEDFNEDETKIFTIRNIEMEEIGKDNKKEHKPIVTFREPDTKALVLNKTNAAIIAKFYGDDTDDWLGKKIALHAIEVESFGDVVRAIRVKTKQPKAPPVDTKTGEIKTTTNDPAALFWNRANELKMNPEASEVLQRNTDKTGAVVVIHWGEALAELNALARPV